MNGKYRIIKTWININYYSQYISVQMHVDIVHITWHSGQRISKKKRKKKYYKWPPLWGSVGGFHLVIKWTATEFLETFSTVLRYLEDIFEEFRIYPWRKKVLRFLLFSISFLFFSSWKNSRVKTFGLLGEILDGITHHLGIIKVQDRKTFSQAPADVFNKGEFWR